MATRAKKSQGGRAATRGKGSSSRGGRGRAATARAGRATTNRSPGRGSTGTARGRARGSGRANAAAATRQQDALALLKSEHDQVSQLFDEFERVMHSRSGNGSSRKSQLATEICRLLQAHATMEEEIFYPAAAAAIDDQDLIPEATVEHQSAKDLIAKIERMDPEDELYDATVVVLGEYVRHHVKEEQNELFPEVKRSDLDLRELGEQMRNWKARETM